MAVWSSGLCAYGKRREVVCNSVWLHIQLTSKAISLVYKYAVKLLQA
jgi:hypothetical protein